jgi:hypothetical protein
MEEEIIRVWTSSQPGGLPVQTPLEKAVAELMVIINSKEFKSGN